MTSIIQPWAAELGLRHQGVLVSAIRGCDSIHREDPSKYLVRTYRGALLVPHCRDLKKAASFMIPFDNEGWFEAADDFYASIDHYPNHWILHWMHASEIVGCKHPDDIIRPAFAAMYRRLVRKFHMHPETEEELDHRLNADEDTFSKRQRD